jgi:hypothetical protein
MCHVNLFGGAGPCCWVEDTKDGEAFREREQFGSWPRKKGKGKARNSGAYDDSYIIDDENDQLSANWEGA